MMMPTGVCQPLFAASVVDVFPNPAAQCLFISTRLEDALQFEIIAPNGQLISSKPFSKQITISLNGVVAGMYFFRVSNKNQVVQNGKFTVN